MNPPGNDRGFNAVRSLGLLAVALVILFGLQLTSVLLPWKPLSPEWQWRLAGSLINGATLPLLALALLQIAVVLAPNDHILWNRHRLFRRLAGPAAAAFLLLIPLQASAGLRQQNAAISARISIIRAEEQRLSALSQATNQARDTADLNRALQKLRGPVLSPADLALPLPLAQAQLSAVFDQARIRINRDRASLPTADLVLPDVIRNGFTSLVLAGAFAAFAYRPSQSLSLLSEGRRLIQSLPRLHGGRSQSRSHAEYIRSLHEEDE